MSSSDHQSFSPVSPVPPVMTLSADSCYTLPAEVLTTIFLLVDPHTLYTSIRSLSKHWRETVEEHLLSRQFNSNNWRIALRVSRRFKSNPIASSLHGASGNGNGNVVASLDNLDDQERLQTVLNIDGLREDELDVLDHDGNLNHHSSNPNQNQNPIPNSSSISDPNLQNPFSAKVKTHVIPLKFEKYDPETTSLAFSTGKEWHALFEQPLVEAQGEEGGENGIDPQDARLDLDFAIVWRFPGDGKDEEQEPQRHLKEENHVRKRELELLKEWGTPDPENNWLSRFHCSGYDVSPVVSTPSSRIASPTSSGISTPSRKLLSTPLARRTRTKLENASQNQSPKPKPRTERTAILRRAEVNPESSGIHDDDEIVCHCHEEGSDGDIDGVNNLIWSDKGHEYINLNLSLGIEFFVRRSARANLLHRKLEQEAVKRFQQDETEEINQVDIPINSFSSSSSEYDEDETSERREEDPKNKEVRNDEKEKKVSDSNPSAWKKPWLNSNDKSTSSSSSSSSSSNSKEKPHNQNLNPDPYAHLPFIQRPKANRINGKSNKSSRFTSPRTSSPLSPLSRSNSHQKNLNSLDQEEVASVTEAPPPSRVLSNNVSRSPTPRLGSIEADSKSHQAPLTTTLSSNEKRPLFHELKQASNPNGKLVASSLPATPSFRSSLKNSSRSKVESDLKKTTEALMATSLNPHPRSGFPTPEQSNLAAKQLALSQTHSLNPTRPSSRSGFRNPSSSSSASTSAALQDVQPDVETLSLSRNGTGTPRARFIGRIFRAEDLPSPSPSSRCLTPNRPSNNSDGRKCEKCLAKKQRQAATVTVTSFPNGGAWEPDPEELQNKPDGKGWMGGDSLGRNQVRMAFDQPDLIDPVDSQSNGQADGEQVLSKAYIWQWTR